jgi:hypothetical protein
LPRNTGLGVRLRNLDLVAVPIDVAVLNSLHFTLPAADLQRADDAKPVTSSRGSTGENRSHRIFERRAKTVA